MPAALDTYAPDLFAGTTALVTGGGRGIGRRSALAFARLGADVAIAGRNEANLLRTADEVRALGRRCVATVTDIRDTVSVEAMVAAAYDGMGRIDHLINNAGGQFPARPSQISDRGFRAVVDLNLHGTWNVCSRVVPRMLAAGAEGSIVNVVHNQVFGRGAPLFIHSGAARAGVVNMTHTMALYLARRGITVNALAPGSVDTEGFREEEIATIAPDDTAAYLEVILRDTPIGRVQHPDEIASHVVFLCSPAARSITGQLLTFDGGHAMGNHNAVYQPDIEW